MMMSDTCKAIRNMLDGQLLMQRVVCNMLGCATRVMQLNLECLNEQQPIAKWFVMSEPPTSSRSVPL